MLARALVLLVVLIAGSVWAGSLPLSIVSLTSPVAPFTDATIQARTAPGANCGITVIYKSGPSVAKGLVPKQADAKGDVAWRWRVGSNTTPGRWPIIVACSKGQDSGRIETTFEVRH
jgi:micrococcal nuclease